MGQDPSWEEGLPLLFTYGWTPKQTTFPLGLLCGLNPVSPNKRQETRIHNKGFKVMTDWC